MSKHRMLVFTVKACVVYSLALSRNLKPLVRAALKYWSRYTSLIVSFDLHLFHIRLLWTAWQPVTCIGLGAGVVADILIAFSMCWFLYHKRTGYARQVNFSNLRRRFG